MRRSSSVFARLEAVLLSSLPGVGLLLGAEFLVAVGDLCAFENANRLAANAGLAPTANDSGKRIGKARRMRGGNKTFLRVFLPGSLFPFAQFPGV
jgi:transposase